MKKLVPLFMLLSMCALLVLGGCGAPADTTESPSPEVTVSPEGIEGINPTPTAAESPMMTVSPMATVSPTMTP